MNRPQNILARNNVHVSGHGARTILFAHGFGCDQNMWRFVAPAFEKDFQVALFDYVGSGGSDAAAYHPERYRTLDGYAQDVLDVCAALDLREAVFVGHSVSGMIGLLASLREPERFARMVLITPSPCYVNDPPDYFGGFDRADLLGLLELMARNDGGWASFLAPVVMQNNDRPELTAELYTRFCATDPEVTRRFAEATFLSDHRDRLSHVLTPSLILQCSEDLIAPPPVGEYLHRRLAGSVLRTIEATGHCPHMSHPEETVRLIKDYLNDATA